MTKELQKLYSWLLKNVSPRALKQLWMLVLLCVFVLWCCVASKYSRIFGKMSEDIFSSPPVSGIWAKKERYCYWGTKAGCSERQKQRLCFTDFFKKCNISIPRCTHQASKMEENPKPKPPPKRHVFIMEAYNFHNRDVWSLETCNLLERRLESSRLSLLCNYYILFHVNNLNCNCMCD